MLVWLPSAMSGSVHEGNKMDGISHDLSNISEIISCSILIVKLA